MDIANLSTRSRFLRISQYDLFAAFAKADEGDVLAAGGNTNSKPGYQGSDNEWENVRRDGQLQLDKAVELWNQFKGLSSRW